MYNLTDGTWVIGQHGYCFKVLAEAFMRREPKEIPKGDYNLLSELRTIVFISLLFFLGKQ